MHYIAIEKYPLAPDVIRKIALHYPELHDVFEAMLAVYPLPFEGTHSRLMYNGRVQLSFKFMAVIQALEDESARVDTWYMDSFSPVKNPGMWNQQLCRLMSQNSIATYWSDA